MRDFWLSCGHHLTDRDVGGGLLVTDEFLKIYLARPELFRRPRRVWPNTHYMLHCSQIHAVALGAKKLRRCSTPTRGRIGIS